MTDIQQRQLAHRVVFTLWPDMPHYPKEHMTPAVATYVFVLYERARAANALIQGLRPLLPGTPPTSWGAIPLALVRSVAASVNARFDERGWALRSVLAVHKNFVKAALQYGPDVYPLALHDAFTR